MNNLRTRRREKDGERERNVDLMAVNSKQPYNIILICDINFQLKDVFTRENLRKKKVSFLNFTAKRLDDFM